jgi:hypothetical protein
MALLNELDEVALLAVVSSYQSESLQLATTELWCLQSG